MTMTALLSACEDVLYQGLAARGYVTNLTGADEPASKPAKWQVGVDTYGYVAWLATDERYRGQGAAARLVEAATKTFLDKGCKMSVAYCVCPTAARVFKRHGYEVWGTIPYKSFVYKGQAPFAILPDEVTIAVKVL
jgi:GNAT superfamily N-acetyltransferase